MLVGEASLRVSDSIFSQEQILYKSEKTGGAHSPGPLLRRAYWLLKSRSCFCLLFDDCVISAGVWRRVAPRESASGTIIHLTGEAVKPENRKIEYRAQADVGIHRILKPEADQIPTFSVSQCKGPGGTLSSRRVQAQVQCVTNSRPWVGGNAPDRPVLNRRQPITKGRELADPHKVAGLTLQCPPACRIRPVPGPADTVPV